jgi:uncharacterized protein with PQ loop repeat
MNQKTVTKIGWVASCMGTLMFISYIDQIRLNISGYPGSIILPLATVLNCAFWTSYGYLKTVKDWPLIISNGFGVIVAGITALTCIS